MSYYWAMRCVYGFTGTNDSWGQGYQSEIRALIMDVRSALRVENKIHSA